jgi:hypothetical protein
MGMAKDDLSTVSNGRRFDRRVGRTLAITHDYHPLAGQLVTRLERRHVDNLALELVATFEDGDVRRFRVKPDAHYDQIKVLDLLSRIIAVGDSPSCA